MCGMFMVMSGVVELVKDLMPPVAAAGGRTLYQSTASRDEQVNITAHASIDKSQSAEPGAASSAAVTVDQLAQAYMSLGGFSGSVDLDDSLTLPTLDCSSLAGMTGAAEARGDGRLHIDRGQVGGVLFTLVACWIFTCVVWYCV